MEDQQNQAQDNSKDAKKFDNNFKKFMLLFGKKETDRSVFSSKIPNDQVSAVVEEMLAENREDALKRFKEKGKALLQKKVEFDKFQKQKQQEMEKAVLEKKKELNKEFEALFAEIENVDNLARDMAAAIKELGGAAEEEAAGENNENPS